MNKHTNPKPALENILKDLEAQMASELDAQADANDVPEMVLQYARRREVHNGSNSELKVLAGAIERSSLTIKELMRQIEETKRESDTVIASLRSQLASQNDEMNSLRSEIRIVSAERDGLEEDLELERHKADEVRESLESLGRQLEEANFLLNERNELLNSLTNMITDDLQATLTDAEKMLGKTSPLDQ